MPGARLHQASVCVCFLLNIRKGFVEFVIRGKESLATDPGALLAHVQSVRVSSRCLPKQP